MSDITLGQFYNAIAQGAREATLEALKGKDFATQTTLAQVKQVLDTLNGAVSTSAGQADIQQAIATLAGIVAKESTLGQAKSVLDAISGKVATDQGVGLVASAVEALAQIAATESTLTQAVQKLESIVSRLQNPLTVDGEVQLKGSDVEDENPIPVKTVAVKSTYMTILNTSTVVNPGESIVTPLQDLSDCQEISLAVRLQSAAKWSAAWQGRTPSNLGLASSHSIDHESSPAAYDAVRAPLLTTHGYAVVRNRDVNPITVTQVAVVKWMTGGMIQ